MTTQENTELTSALEKLRGQLKKRIESLLEECGSINDQLVNETAPANRLRLERGWFDKVGEIRKVMEVFERFYPHPIAHDPHQTQPPRSYCYALLIGAGVFQHPDLQRRENKREPVRVVEKIVQIIGKRADHVSPLIFHEVTSEKIQAQIDHISAHVGSKSCLLFISGSLELDSDNTMESSIRLYNGGISLNMLVELIEKLQESTVRTFTIIDVSGLPQEFEKAIRSFSNCAFVLRTESYIFGEDSHYLMANLLDEIIDLSPDDIDSSHICRFLRKKMPKWTIIPPRDTDFLVLHARPRS